MLINPSDGKFQAGLIFFWGPGARFFIKLETFLLNLTVKTINLNLETLEKLEN